jgi:hypothetical protein
MSDFQHEDAKASSAVWACTVAVAFLLPSIAMAQGLVSINFANGAAGVNAPVRDASQPGEPFVYGSSWLAQLYWARGNVSDPSLLATNDITGGPSPFLPLSPGYSGGYFLGNARLIGRGESYVIATLQVRTWLVSSGTSWETATIRGESNLFGWDHGADAPPKNLFGLQPWSNYAVPEPSFGLLALCGLAVVALQKRR